jgi:hypothetical protein
MVIKYQIYKYFLFVETFYQLVLINFTPTIVINMTENIDKILDHSFAYAQELLYDTKEFYPFGAYIDSIHNVHPLEFDPDSKNQPQVKTVLESLTKYCESEIAEGNMLSFGMTYEAELLLEEGAQPVKCIAIDVKDKDNTENPIFYQSYSIDEDGELSFGEKFAVKR